MLIIFFRENLIIVVLKRTVVLSNRQSPSACTVLFSTTYTPFNTNLISFSNSVVSSYLERLFSIDVDECVENLYDCHVSAYCVNTEGSYNCSCHQPGYSYNGTTCVGM